MLSILTENVSLLLLGLVFILTAVVSLLYWYLRQLVTKFLFVTDNIEDLATLVKNYSSHLGKVYELETFYGDETLHSLLKHTGYIIEEMKQYETADQLMEGEENMEYHEEKEKE